MLRAVLQKLHWLWLITILVVLIAISQEIPFHGDETNHILNSLDYTIAFIDKSPADLMIGTSRSDRDYYRLVDGSITRYLFGFAFHLSGFTADDLPAGYWGWSGTPSMYQENVEVGNRPSTAILNTARLVSTLLFWCSTVMLFRLSKTFQGGTTAYIVSLLYVFSALLLLYVLRAMQEGAVLFFGVLLVSTAAFISITSDTKWYTWLLLIIAGGFAVATKINSVSFVITVLLWLFVSQIRKNIRPIVSFAKCAAIAGLMLMVMIAVSPGLWSNPVKYIPEMIAERISAMNGQVTRYNDNAQPLPVSKRLEYLGTMPFLIYPDPGPYQDYWEHQPTPEGSYYTFQNSVLAVPLFHRVIGIPATCFMLFGLLSCVKAIGSTNLKDREFATGLLIWYLVTGLMLITNSLPWYRYYIPLVPPAVLLAGQGINALFSAGKSFLESRTKAHHDELTIGEAV